MISVSITIFWDSKVSLILLVSVISTFNLSSSVLQKSVSSVKPLILTFKSSISFVKVPELYWSDFRFLAQADLSSLTISSFCSITSKPINLDKSLPFWVGNVWIKSSKLSEVAIIVNKKSSTSPIDFLINSSVSLRCSPSRF